MNSHCHSSFLAIGAWFIEQLGGIQCDVASPGFKHVILRPAVTGDLTFARAEYDSIHGPIKSDWRREGKAFDWRITVPANTTATVYVPASDTGEVIEGNAPAAKAPGVQFLRAQAGHAVYSVGAGTYHFRSTLTP